MSTNKLTKAQISKLKSDAKSEGKTKRLADGGGLYLQAEPNGGLYWRMAYRVGKPPKQKTLSFGVWPDVDVDAAREKRRLAKIELKAGRDPGEVWRGAGKPTVGGQTFGAVAAELLAKMEREEAAPATIKKNRWLLEKLAAPLADEPIADLTAADIQRVLASIEASERYESAVRLRGAIGAVFRHAIRTARATNDPTAALVGGLTSPAPKHYAAIIKPRPVGRLLLAIDSFPGSKIVRLALQLAPLVFVRPGELRAMAWDEVSTRKARWIIPAAKTKQRREHIVPLARQALALLEEARELSGEHDFVFPNSRSPREPMSEGTLASALAQIGYSSKVHTPHGFRSTASTLLNASKKWSPDVIEAQLAHKPVDRIRAIYNRDDYMEDRIAMMTWWADECDRLRLLARRRSVSELLGPEPSRD